MTESYLKLSIGGYKKYKEYSLILAKALYTCNFINIKNRLSLHFPNFSEFLENFGAGTEYRAFRLGAIILAYAFIFMF